MCETDLPFKGNILYVKKPKERLIFWGENETLHLNYFINDLRTYVFRKKIIRIINDTNELNQNGNFIRNSTS